MTTDELRESANYSERKGALYDARIKREAADEIDSLTRRVAELERESRVVCRNPEHAHMWHL